MKVIWSADAIKDILKIRTYIGHDNVSAAKIVAATIIYSTENQLEMFPLSGRNGLLIGTHELVIPKLPYIVVYQVCSLETNILRVYHTSRLRPE